MLLPFNRFHTSLFSDGRYGEGVPGSSARNLVQGRGNRVKCFSYPPKDPHPYRDFFFFFDKSVKGDKSGFPKFEGGLSQQHNKSTWGLCQMKNLNK